MPHSKPKPVSIFSIANKTPDRMHYLKEKEKMVRQCLGETMDVLYHSLATTFTLDQFSLYDFHKYIWPMVSSGGAFLVGELATKELQLFLNQDKEFELMVKFCIGVMLLSFSAMHRITEQRPKTITALSKAVASEVLAILYLYTTSFQGSQLLLEKYLPENYSLIVSLSLSGIAIPGGFSYLVQKYQEHTVKKAYALGAQRSDTALISSGATRLANAFFQANHFILSELVTLSRLFQLNLIANNILHAPKIINQFRNFPALCADISPAVLKSLLQQKSRIEEDYHYNTTLQKVLKLTQDGPQFVYVERYRLRNGDLVACDENFSLDSVPVSGTIIAIETHEKQSETITLNSKKISINLKAHNGEDVWIEYKTATAFPDKKKRVDLHEIHAGKQAAVLAGAKLNLYDGRGFYICIQDQTERTLSGSYIKRSVINQIVSDFKKRQVIFSMVFSLAMGTIQSVDVSSYISNTLRLLFNLSQMLIPFAETFLREMVNGRLLKDINRNLETPLSIMDALRVVDFLNALGGYYKNRFPKGVAIVSDKTGTLTTAKMDVLGFWTVGMANDVQHAGMNEQGLLLPLEKLQQDQCYELFASVFTNNKKDIEPEEFAILSLFENLFPARKPLKIDVLGNNYFRKRIDLETSEKVIETFHLGLYRSLGGRLTLIDEGDSFYLAFCGIPKATKFLNMPLFEQYSQMDLRTGVLSRDWCVARAPLSRKEFEKLKAFFFQEDKAAIESFLCSESGVLNKLSHFGTFLINNPIKHGVEHFISKCKYAKVPVFIATGDTRKSAENIAKVLCADYANHIITMDDQHVEQWMDQPFPSNATVIFSGINDNVLRLFHRLLQIDIENRPIIIFSEMSTEKKGVLVEYLKEQKFFVVANGDGSNDVAMMRQANMVLAHVMDDGQYALGVEQFVDLSDKQLQGILGSDRSFYEIFDIHDPHSQFMRAFTSLANSQEKPSIALLLKSSKMSFELARAVGFVVTDIPGLHWWGVGFDLAWLWIAFDAINATVDLPMDNQSLDESNFSSRCLFASMIFAMVSSAMLYTLSGESTNLTWMLLVLSFLPLLLRSIFSGFAYVQETIPSTSSISECENENTTTGASTGALSSTRRLSRAISTFFSPHKEEPTTESRAIQTEPTLAFQ